MVDRDKQIELMTGADDRRDAYVREWKNDAEFMNVLHRYDHEFDDEPVRRVAHA